MLGPSTRLPDSAGRATLEEARPAPRLPSQNGTPAPGAPSPAASSVPAAPLRFGAFVFDRASGELLRDGRPVKLAPQPARALQYMVENAGRLLSREELKAMLWDDGRHVDFDQGLGYCIRQIREALEDSVENPRYIVTLPRRGFRFIAAVSAEAPAAAKRSPRRWWLYALALGALGAAALAVPVASWRGAQSAFPQLSVATFATPSQTEGDRLVAEILREELLVRLADVTPQRNLAVREADGAGDRAPLLLEGSVYELEGELTLALRLVRTADRTTMWGRTFRQRRAGDAWREWPAAVAAELGAVAEEAAGARKIR